MRGGLGSEGAVSVERRAEDWAARALFRWRDARRTEQRGRCFGGEMRGGLGLSLIHI